MMSDPEKPRGIGGALGKALERAGASLTPGERTVVALVLALAAVGLAARAAHSVYDAAGSAGKPGGADAVQREVLDAERMTRR